MITAAPLAPPTAAISRFNPVAKLAPVLVITAMLVLVTDPVTPALMLAVELAALTVSGIHVGRFLGRARLLLFGAGAVVLVNAMYAKPGGEVYLDVGPVHVTETSVETGFALGLRVLAIAIPGILALAATDPTDLADSLVQQLRVSPRFAIGALAALRLLPLLGEEWRLITMARRARGVDANWNPWKRLRLFASATFALLVAAIRRGIRLATAMDARGFDSGTPRTSARPQTVRARDWVLIAATMVFCVTVVAMSVWFGTFRTVF
ncbi:energy-coupling factor transporter transmembrane component T family protein [Stackebrandtia nassauensis]|uniref:Cobalt transport protein n=1 Tax=Stackebrandtia nassauensis (strain DSM 44728 / CIP 108903 / NRRL B-16338 / NBRC 102104 / LLR-40K-21) TaxID=446470 RepID=D3Q0K3_STANL|nr:energy-coupling factor transporter transmembrane component T [Stackebrandtia nassauensis]ADD41739.1 cobalt transport protein [Stackebrandtia nassauensis DSM 44728]